MTHLERRLAQLEEELHTQATGPTLEERLREAQTDARERRRLGLPHPLLEGEGPRWDRYRMALARAQQARARLASAEPGPW
jgi:hypothetical protein